MKLNLLTLKFSGESSALEGPFLSDYRRGSLFHIRISLVLGALLYAAFGGMDAFLMPEQKYTAWLIRFVVFGPVISGVLLASFSKFFERYMQSLLGGAIILAGGGIVGMIVIAPTPVNYSYYAGMILVLMWGYTFLRVRFIWASLAGWVQIVLYEIVAIWITPTPFLVLLNNNFFLISANLIGMLACYSIEFYARRDFFLSQQLEVEREKVNKAYQGLEEQVEKRTADYQIANQALEQEIAKHERTEKELEKTLESLRHSVGATIQAMVAAIGARDPYTAAHQVRSTDLARAIATEMGLSQDEIDGIRMAGSIHDIGKLSIPADILSKPTKLSEFELAIVKDHAEKGYTMLKDVDSPWPLAEIVYEHHERMDGSGYPRNLKGEEILRDARILAVADVVEAMASHRPYRPSLGIDAALEEIEKNRGILYDSDVVDACVRLFRERGYHLVDS